jgi:predicted RNA-binding Zn-ribbon protein involved in translation (DUF1610 family)
MIVVMAKSIPPQADPPITDANDLLVGMNERAARWGRAVILWLWSFSLISTLLIALNRPQLWYWMILYGLIPPLIAAFISTLYRRVHRRRVLNADCIYCGCVLTGDASSICPKCGNRIIVLPAGSLKRHTPEA